MLSAREIKISLADKTCGATTLLFNVCGGPFKMSKSTCGLFQRARSLYHGVRYLRVCNRRRTYRARGEVSHDRAFMSQPILDTVAAYTRRRTKTVNPEAAQINRITS